MRKILAVMVIFAALCTNTLVFAQNDGLQTVEDTQNTALQTNTDQPYNEETKETQQERIDRLNEEMGLGEQRQIVIDDIKSSPNDNVALTNKVVPDTKSELAKMVKMFLKVMIAVAVSSVVIFVVLLFVRRFYSPVAAFDESGENNEKRNTLDTPQNKNEALRTFLDKTKEM